MRRVILCLAAGAAAASTAAATRQFWPKALRFRPRAKKPSNEVSGREQADGAWDWLANLGAPAALVAGAVQATLVDQEAMLRVTKKTDPLRWARYAKQGAHLLLVSAFALSVFSVFSTTVTGTMLKSLGDRHGAHTSLARESPVGYLQANHETEYLLSRFCFLQGLLNWLAGMALMYIGNAPAFKGKATSKMYYCIGTGLFSMVLFIVGFTNTHIIFYCNYAHLVYCFAGCCFRAFFLSGFRPMPVLAFATFGLALSFLREAILADLDDDDDDDAPDDDDVRQIRFEPRAAGPHPGAIPLVGLAPTPMTTPCRAVPTEPAAL